MSGPSLRMDKNLTVFHVRTLSGSRLGDLEVDRKLVLGCHLDWQVAGFFALRDPVGIARRLSKLISEVERTQGSFQRRPDAWCKKLEQRGDVYNRFNIEDGLLNRRLATLRDD